LQQLIKEQIQKITAEDNEEAIIQKIEMYHLEIARRYKLLRRMKYSEQFDQDGKPIDPKT
jgi:2-phosphoglycerate kinase